MSVPSEFRGWTIAEAIRRTLPRERLRDCRAPAIQLVESRYELFEDLRDVLLRNRLLAWGRRSSPLVASQAIPSIAWKSLKLVSPRESTIREMTKEKTELFDVRI